MATVTDDIPNANTDQRRPQAALTFALLTAFLLPFSILPYLATRRHMTSLQRKLDDVRRIAMRSQLETKNALVESANMREARIRASLEKMKKDLDGFHLQSEREHNARKASENRLHHSLQKLLDGRHEHTRTQNIILRELGTSLADIAAFMHEMELEQGLTTKDRDQRGIERLRSLSLKMLELSQSKEAMITEQRETHGGNV